MKASLFKITRGITFRTWAIFTAFASIILIALWLLQLSLVTPYYRNAKINAVQTFADNIETMIYNNESLNSLNQLAQDNALCIAIIDNYGNVTPYNGIGSSCYIASGFEENGFDYDEFYAKIVNSSNHEANYFVDYGSEMIVFGRQINPHLGSFTLLINAKITPEKAGLILIQNQFILLTIIVLILATIASLIIAKNMSKPFIDMTTSARKLAAGNFNVSFDVSDKQYNEFTDLAETLNYATEKLKRMDQLRMDLIANVSHDIKTPLTMILAYSEMINDFSKDNPELLKEHLEVIQSEAKYLDLLVDDILELSIAESGNMNLNMSIFSINQLLLKAKDHFKVDINIHVEALKDYWVQADELRIQQVLYNFIKNAINHADATTIILRVKKEHDLIKVSVIDNGIGIKEEELSTIWDRYFKIDKNFTRDFHSSGLGLSISKGIINSHNQEVGVISKYKSGSEFYFYLQHKKD